MKGIIGTNILEMEWNVNAIAERFDFYRMNSTAKYPKNVLIGWSDKLSDKPGIVSVLYIDGSSAYIMTDKNVLNKDDLNEIARESSTEAYDSVTFDDLQLDPLVHEEENILIQLFINSMKGLEIGENKANNLSGKYILPYKVRKSTIEAIDFQVEFYAGYNVLNLALVPYTKADFLSQNYPEIARLKPEELCKRPHYCLDDDLELRSTPSRDSKYFVQAQIPGKHEKLPFLSFNKKKLFSNKAYFMHRFIEKFNLLHKGLSSMSLKNMDEASCIVPIRGSSDVLKDKIKEMVSAVDVNVVCYDNSTDTESVAKHIQTELEKVWNKKSTMTLRTPVPQAFNIIVIHSPAYYADRNLDDPHEIVYHMPVQHVTIENYGSNDTGSSLTWVLAKELIIKKDLQEGKISLFDWPSIGLAEDCTFIRFCFRMIEKANRSSLEKEYHCYSMTVHKNGSFSIGEVKNSSDEFGEFLPYLDRIGKGERIYGEVLGSDGKHCLIKETPIRSVPDLVQLFKMYEDIAKQDGGRMKNGPRTTFSKKNIINSVLNIRTMVLDGRTFYLSGYDENTLRTDLNAVNVREVILSENSEQFFGKIIETMNVAFVKYGSLTVYPFPFKYISEAFEEDYKYMGKKPAPILRNW